jgi:LL-H family phage holin
MNDIIMKAFSDFLAIVLPVLVSALAAVAVNYFRLLEQRIKNEKPDLYKVLDVLVKQGVSAAEQLGLNGEIADKKTYAIKYVQDMLNQYGLKGIDVSVIEAKIEAAVFDEITKSKPLPLIEEKKILEG